MLLAEPDPGLVKSAPLLEEERHVGAEALVAHHPWPQRIHAPCTTAALTARNHPVDSIEVEFERAQQRLTGQEPNSSRDTPKILDPRSPPLVLDRDPSPDVLSPVQLVGQGKQALRSLGQYLESVPLGSTHHLEDTKDKGVRDTLVEEIRHAVHEDQAWSAPLQRLLQSLRSERQVEALLVRMPLHTSKPLGKRKRVAIGTTRRHLGTPSHRVPRRLGPFDRRLVTHNRTSVLLILASIARHDYPPRRAIAVAHPRAPSFRCDCAPSSSSATTSDTSNPTPSTRARHSEGVRYL